MLNVFGITPAEFETFLLVMVRATTILFVVPIFSSAQIPRLARIGLGILISFLIWRTVPVVAVSKDFYELFVAVVAQFVLGLLIGFMSYLVFMGIQLAGELIDIQMGFAIANVINPLTQQNVTIIGEFQLAIATLIFLLSNSHYVLLQGISGSFAVVPLPWIKLDQGVAQNIVYFFTQGTLIIFKIATPAAISLFITNVALGLMAKVAPQMNVFVVGLPLQVTIGLIMIGVSLPLIGIVVPDLYSQLPAQLTTVLRDLRV